MTKVYWDGDLVRLKRIYVCYSDLNSKTLKNLGLESYSVKHVKECFVELQDMALSNVYLVGAPYYPSYQKHVHFIEKKLLVKFVKTGQI